MGDRSPGRPGDIPGLSPIDVPGPAEAAGGKSSRARGGEGLLPEKPAPSAAAADLRTLPSVGQKQMMPELLA